MVIIIKKWTARKRNTQPQLMTKNQYNCRQLNLDYSHNESSIK